MPLIQTILTRLMLLVLLTVLSYRTFGGQEGSPDDRPDRGPTAGANSLVDGRASPST
jgi:hypothetical protein